MGREGVVARVVIVFLCWNSFLHKLSECAVPNVYFPTELHNIAAKLSTDDIRSFIHTATFLQNSNVMTLENKVSGLNVMTALRNFQQCKIGDYYRTLLRMWAKFSKEDRLKNKDEMFRNIDSLKIPENFKTAFKAMFEHVDGLQKVIVNAAKTTTAVPTTAISETVAATEVPPTTASIFAMISEDFSSSPEFQTIAPAAIV